MFNSNRGKYFAWIKVSLRQFVTLLSGLGKNQLGLEIRKERDCHGSYFVGLKIRGENDQRNNIRQGFKYAVTLFLHDALTARVVKYEV
ncbi:MAG: hypothetical protein HC939_08180 [Pleurocapsa sp. SU_5_0]|nr:hypothetical protein [Pleurocapsa sp. SU_5_0]NJO98220.1 hypothetical protein [Pleurocapsa sp. CRU_1_2]